MDDRQYKPSVTYLTARELAERIKYKPAVITNLLKDAVLLEGQHYIRPFGRRKVLYLWKAVEQTMVQQGLQTASSISMGN
jgi:hypothetical protein